MLIAILVKAFIAPGGEVITVFNGNARNWNLLWSRVEIVMNNDGNKFIKLLGA